MTPLRRLRRAAIDVEPLRHADFRRLWLGNSLGFIGFQLTAVAVPVQVYELTGSSFWVGMLGLVGLVPLVMFGLWGGAVADAVDRRLLLLGSSLTLWGCTGGLLVAALLELASLPLLLGLVAVQAAGFAVASSTRGAIVPRVLPVPLVPAANTLSFTASNVGMVLGPLLAGLILARWSFAAAYAADFVVFTIALYAALRLPALPPAGAAITPGLRSVVDGLTFIVTRPVLLLSFAVDIVAMVLAMPRALFPETAEQLGGRGAVGWLYAAIAGGAVVAGLSSGWIGRVRRQGVALVAAVVAWGLAVAAAGLARSLWVIVALLAVAGAADLPPDDPPDLRPRRDARPHAGGVHRGRGRRPPPRRPAGRGGRGRLRGHCLLGRGRPAGRRPGRLRPAGPGPAQLRRPLLPSGRRAR
jgi:MFS family permease